MTTSSLWLPPSVRKDTPIPDVPMPPSVRMLNSPARVIDRAGKGVELKIANHKLYYDMYVRHPVVFSAVNKIVKVCTNTGYDFVPRDQRTTVNESEVAIARKFFDKQHTFIAVLRQIYQDLLIYGDAYMYIVPDRKRRPVKLKRLPPWSMIVMAAPNGEVTGYRQYDPNKNFSPSSDDFVSYQEHEVIHFKMNDPNNDLYGLSPLESLKFEVEGDLNASIWNSSFFRNGATTGTVFVFEEASEEELERAEEYLIEKYSTPEKAHIPIAVSGKLDIKNPSLKHQDMGFDKLRQFVIETILSVLDVPPAKIGRMETANRSNSKEQDKSFRSEAVAPLQNVIEYEFSDHFMREILGLERTMFQHSQTDTRDAQDQMQVFSLGIKDGVYTINEVRAKMGYPPIPGGDVAFVMSPTGAVPVDLLPQYFRMPRQDDSSQSVAAAAGLDITDKNPPNIPDEMVTGQAPATKSLTERFNALVQSLSVESPTDKELRRAFTYALDCREFNLAASGEICRSLEKAMTAANEQMRLAYFERAQDEALSVLGGTA